MKLLAKQTFKHVKDEESMLRDVFAFLTCINKVGCEALHKHETEHGKPTIQIPKNVPSQQEDGQPGVFDASAMDNDALQFMMEFNPPGYQKMPPRQVANNLFPHRFKVPMLPKPFSHGYRLQTFGWPVSVSDPDPSN